MTKYNLLDEMIAQTKLSKKHTEKQQKIAETAIIIFAEKGYANTSTSEIAKAAGVAEGTIFRHYGTKDNLLLSVILPFIKEMIPTMAEGVFNEIKTENVESFQEFLSSLLKNRVEFLNENKEVFRIIVKEVIYKEELKYELLPYFKENVMIRLTTVIENYIERGELIDLPSSEILKRILTFMGGYFVSRYVLQSDSAVIDEEKEINHITNFVMNGIKK